MKHIHIVADKSVRNFGGEFYYNRRNSNVSPVFVAGVGLERLTFTFPLNPPLTKGGLVARLCLALLRNLEHIHIVADKSVINFDTESYYNGQPNTFPKLRTIFLGDS